MNSSRQNFFCFRTFYQLGFAMLIVAALVIQFAYGAVMEGFAVHYVGTFLTYFTILSNIFVAVVLATEARASILGKELPARFSRARSTAVFCIVTTGIIYSLFLRGPGSMNTFQDSIPWINAVFHYVMPVVMVLDWVLFPSKEATRWRAILAWIFLTVLYLVYVELLGLLTHTYPYFFLDPVRFNGYLGVLRASITFVPFFAILGVLLILIARARTRIATLLTR